MSADEKVLLVKKGFKAYLILNRPEKLNAVTTEIYQKIKTLLEEVDTDPEVRVLIIKGNGRAFSAGWDISATEHNDLESARYINENLCNANRWKIWNFTKPVIAQIHGYCFGGACELILPCDYVYAANNCLIGEPEIQFGDAPCFLMIPWLVNNRKAKELLLTGEKINGTEAEKIGLITRAFPPEQLEEEVEKLANKLIKISPPCIQNQKRGINRAYEVMGMRAAIDSWVDQALWNRVLVTDEVKEFNRIVSEKGVKAALAWQDDYFKAKE
jgi:enoyl-CoA hydratase